MQDLEENTQKHTHRCLFGYAAGSPGELGSSRRQPIATNPLGPGGLCFLMGELKPRFCLLLHSDVGLVSCAHVSVYLSQCDNRPDKITEISEKFRVQLLMRASHCTGMNATAMMREENAENVNSSKMLP